MGATVEELSAATMFRDDIMEQLPPGFRFHPTDEEVIVNYLMEKVSDRRFSPRAIGEVDLNKCEPWDLPSKAMMGEKEWYFYCHKDKKYPTGTRTNRATECGYWKATGKDKGIYKGEGRNLIGRKKTLVFYRGRAPKGRKTNWVMHEFRLDGESSHRFPKNERDKWVVCRVTVKSADPIRKRRISTSSSTEVFCPIDTSPLPPLTDSPYPNYPKTNDRSSSKLPAEDKWNIDFVDVFPTMAVENQLRRNPNNTVVNQELNPFTTNTYAPFSTTPSVVHTPSPVNTFYLHQNGSSTGLTGLNQQMSTLETTTSTLQQVSEQHKNQSLVSAYPATSCDDWGTGMSQQLVSWESCDDIDDLLPPLPLSPVNFDAFFNP